MEAEKTKRLEALDLLRGLTIMLMIVVNSPGSWNYVCPALRHSAWDGLTLADVIFPCFLFIMGITTFLSLQKRSFAFSRQLLLKVVRRAAVLFLLGLLINYCAAGFPSAGELRIPGVLQRFAVCYLVVSLLAVAVSRRWMAVIAGAILAVYAALTYVGGGFEYGGGNLLAAVDRALLGTHMMNDGGCDPEGILSTLPSIAHTIIGFCVGSLVTARTALAAKLLRIAAWGTALLFAGLLLDSFFPVNKRVWSATFVLATCGISSLALVWLSYVVDVRQLAFPKHLLKIFGTNPLFCYIVGELLYIALYSVTVTRTAVHAALGVDPSAPLSLQDILYYWLTVPFGDNALTSFLFALAIVALVGLLAHLLYRKGVIIKI